MTTQRVVGSIVSLWRYPVKSMMGEELNAAEVSKSGLLGDRAYALVDSSDGKVASAKNPRKWPQLFDCRAALADVPRTGAKVPPVRITLPDGTIVNSEQPDLHQILSKVLKREVALGVIVHGHQEVVESGLPNLRTATAEEYWPDIEGLEYRETVTGEKDFVENAWIGQVLAIRDAIRLSITGPCPRCVMTTLPQGDLPKDAGILRTAAQHNRANVGVYASVLQVGTVRRGDSVRLEE